MCRQLWSKFFNEDDANHLITTLEKYYKISVDCNGGNYYGPTLDWHYKDNYVDALMPGFVPKSLQKFQHTAPVKPQYVPHKWNQPKYGQKVQYAPPPDASDSLDKKATHKIQAIVVTFLYYG
eukprot:7209420-Ditylum_brightwellii.AAC.1